MGTYRIVRSPYYRPSELALARPYTEIADAVADMGHGVVIAEDGHIAAFHADHERIVAHRLNVQADLRRHLGSLNAHQEVTA